MVYTTHNNADFGDCLLFGLPHDYTLYIHMWRFLPKSRNVTTRNDMYVLDIM